MSLHKLSAGHGYDYLIRQVAALDATHRGRTDLASYYRERGELPGRWIGRGLKGVDGLEVGDVVTADQMRLLFAEGRHPLAGQAKGGARGQVIALGMPYRSSGREHPFQTALRLRFAEHNAERVLPAHRAVPAGVRARMRGELAAEWHRREPVSYTHLRAHETEVNLVCRLLLEKKNFFNDTATTEIYT